MKLSLVCLRVTRYSDSRAILTAYSREAGRVSLSFSCGQGRGAARLRALTMPLSLLEVETAERSDNREILTLRSAAPLAATPLLFSDPSRSTQALFLAEVLCSVLRQGAPDAAMFDFIAGSVVSLDTLPDNAVPMFHLCFLSCLARIIGIEPDVSTYGTGTVFFDIREGVWRKTAPPHSDFLSGNEAEGAYIIAGLDYARINHVLWGREQRRRALDLLLNYFSIHAAPLHALKSLDVLRSLV